MSMRLTLFAALLLLSSFAAMPAEASSWVYYDIREPRNQFMLEDSPPRSAWMDVVGSAHFCARDDSYLCFKAADFQFAVPTHFKGNETHWTYDGVSYEVSGTSRRYILGRRYLAYFIERELGPHKLRFLFTREAGLIAITTVGDSQGMILILAGKCGFGAPPLCYKSK
jgi:hypothetical protein